MSMGYGKVQRALLVVLQDHDRNAGPQQAAEGMTTDELINRVYHRRPWPASLLPQAEASAVRRALAALARDGLVFRLGRMRRYEQCRWRSPGKPAGGRLSLVRQLRRLGRDRTPPAASVRPSQRKPYAKR
jgi:hypothetical protein